MEYLIGSLITLGIIYGCLLLIRSNPEINFEVQVEHSQSYMHNILFPFLPTNEQLEAMTPVNCQTLNHSNKAYLDILVVEDNAYWIKDNTFFVADILNGEIVKESAKKVDTMSMDKLQLDKMEFIVDLLTKGKKDDRGSTGNS